MKWAVQVVTVVGLVGVYLAAAAELGWLGGALFVAGAFALVGVIAGAFALATGYFSPLERALRQAIRERDKS